MVTLTAQQKLMPDKKRKLLAFILGVLLISVLLYNHLQTGSREVLASSPDQEFSLSRAGVDLLGSGKNDSQTLARAVELLTLSYQLDPKDPLTLFGLGWGQQLQKNNARAMIHYDQAFRELMALTSFTLFNRSLLKEELGDHEGALEDIVMLRSMAPQFTKAEERELYLRSRIVSTGE